MNNGFYVVVTLDRLKELYKFLKSFRKHHNEPIMMMFVDGVGVAHEHKTLAGQLSPFDNTVMMDCDMYVLQNISDLFDKVKDGNVAVWNHERWDMVNSGLVAFNAELGSALSKEWHKRFLARDGKNRMGEKGLWEQDILDEILKSDEWKDKVYNLPMFYNYCVNQKPVPNEDKDWEQIKVLHYWHRGGFQLDPKKMSSKVWIGERNMVGKNPGLVAEMLRLKEIYSQHARLNTKRLDLLEHLLEVHGIETGEIKPEKPKDWEELEAEKKEQKKKAAKKTKPEAE